MGVCTVSENISDHYTPVILCDDMSEGFVGEGCIGAKDVIGYCLGKCLVHYDAILAEFVMEEFSYIRKHKVKNGIGGINMVEVRNNKV